MTHKEFLVECGKRLLTPDIVLENDDIRQALKDRNDDEVISLLESEF